MEKWFIFYLTFVRDKTFFGESSSVDAGLNRIKY